MFDKNHYKNQKAKVEELIKKTLPNWETEQGFMLDGIYAPDIYENEPLKILVILSETYGYGKYKMTEIEKQPNINTLVPSQSHVVKVPSVNKIAKLLWLLFNSIKQNKLLLKSEVPLSYNNANKLKEALLKIAWINVKKESGLDSRQNNFVVHEHAILNKDILTMQIESISPNLIIVCGDVAMNSICNLNILGRNLKSNHKNNIQINECGQKIIHLSHPSYYKDWGYNSIYDYYHAIYTGLYS